ncbi:hypothetical protein [Rhodopirellula halodulae]|uniref:hypothetical protein n=1 Tax=Rhodopirellula halodulae TaxID=2894198 RepID=UPI001E4627A8|nr:hypothetical protein [Rhodopirellula sp. JC737]MCC9656702.1 hypothetical protein [Rhodopirellula sp. JC737]
MLVLLITVCTLALYTLDHLRAQNKRHPYNGIAIQSHYLTSPCHFVIVGYIYLHYLLVLIMLPAMRTPESSVLWHAPLFAPVPLASIARLMSAAVLGYTLVCFVFRPGPHPRLRCADSLTASFEIVFVCSTFFAIPQNLG